MKNETMEILRKACAKSIKKVRREYRKKLRALDPEKVLQFKKTAFIVCLGTATLASAFAVKKVAIEIYEYAYEKTTGIDLDEEKQLVNALDNYEKSIIDNYFMPLNSEKRPDVAQFCVNLGRSVAEQSGQQGYIYLDAYIQKYGKNQEIMDGIIRYLAQVEGADYTTLEGWLKAHGFNSYDNFRHYCIDLYGNRIPKTNDQSKDYSIDEITEILMSTENQELAVYLFLNNPEKTDEQKEELLSKLGFLITNMPYNSLEDYVTSMGFQSVEEWEEYYKLRVNISEESEQVR